MAELSNAKRPFPILLLGAQMATGGAQRILLLQADWFFQHGYPVTAAFLYDKEHLLPVWCSQHRFPIYDLGFGSPAQNLFTQATRFVQGSFRLFQLMRRGRYAAIETFALHANLIGLPLAWLTGVPNRIASHRGKIEGISPILERINAGVVNSWLARCLVVVADRVREDAIAEGVKPTRIVKIANGVVLPEPDLEQVKRVQRDLGLNQSDRMLLSVGRLRHQKGHSVLLKALPGVLRQFPNVQVLIAGDGVLRPDLEAEAAALGVSTNVKFLGMRRDVPALMAMADMFIFPSRFEGMPNALLEAMSNGLPVIATSVQGVDEIVRDGQNGLIVPMDDPTALEQAIIRLMANPAEMAGLGRAARATIENEYTVEIMCRQYEQLLTRDWSRNS